MSEAQVLFRFSESMSRRRNNNNVSGFNHASKVTMSVIGKIIYFVIRFYTIVEDQRIYQPVNLKGKHVQPLK